MAVPPAKNHSRANPASHTCYTWFLGCKTEHCTPVHTVALICYFENSQTKLQFQPTLIMTKSDPYRCCNQTKRR